MRAWINRHLYWTAFIVFAVAGYFVQEPMALYLLVGTPLALWIGYKKRCSKWYIPLLILLPITAFVLENKSTNQKVMAKKAEKELSK